MGKNNGGGNNGGGGGNGKGKGKGKGKKQEKTMEQIINRAVRGAARYAFGPQLTQNRQDIKAARGHHGTVDRAYDAYASELTNLQAAEQNATNLAEQGIVGGAQQIMGAADQVAGAQTNEAQAIQARLGMSASPSDMIGDVTHSSGISRGDAAVRDLAQAANVGLASTSDLLRRQGTAERDRIRSHGEVRDRVYELKQERKDIKREKGGYMAEAYANFLEQQQQNAIAMMGLRNDRRASKADQEMDMLNYNLDFMDTIHDNQAQDLAEQHDTQNDQRDDRDNDGGQGGQGGGGGLSPSQQEYFSDQMDKVQTAAGEIRRIMQTQNVDMQEARRRAQQQGGLEEWAVRIASVLVREGKLTRAAKQMWRSHVPGDHVPKQWM